MNQPFSPRRAQQPEPASTQAPVQLGRQGLAVLRWLVAVVALVAAAPASASCGELVVAIAAASGEWTVEGVSCDHGSQDSTGSLGNGENQAGWPFLFIFSQSVFYGPDCSINLSDTNGNSVVVRAQQNLCSSMSGTITLSIPEGGSFVQDDDSNEGDFNDGTPGAAYFVLSSPTGSAVAEHPKKP